MTKFTLTIREHLAFGPLLRLEAGGLRLDLTPAEAASISGALGAALDGLSRETEIYLSPIASDGEFAASVRPDGVTLAGAGEFDWPSVERLAKALAPQSFVGNRTRTP